MPLYSTNEIQTLLEAAAYKAGVELNTHGFQKLSEAIIREGDPYGVRMTPRYLKESIWQKAQSALSNNSIEIGLSEDRVDTLSLYLGFPHYKAYRHHYLEWKEVVNPKVVAKRSNKPTDLQVVSHEEDAITFGDQFKKSLDYSGLKYNWLNPNQEKATEQLEEAVYSIWLLSNKWSSDQILQMLKDDQLLSKKAKNILFFKLCELSPEVENTIPFNTEKLKLVSDPQLGIILSVFKSTLKPFGDDTKGRSNKNKNSIHTEIKKFKKFKGIFLDGKANIQAKYMAGGDMYIKIKK
jgi:hypothetical protein